MTFEQRQRIRHARSARRMLESPWVPDYELDIGQDGVCPECGAEFEVVAGRARRKWCSTLCRKRAGLRRDRMRAAA